MFKLFQYVRKCSKIKVDSYLVNGTSVRRINQNILRRFSSEDEKSPAETRKNDSPPSYNPRPSEIAGMKVLTPREKKWMKMSGRWKNEEIPDKISHNVYASTLWIVRIRIATFMMILWFITALIVSKFGRQHEREQAHRVVMQEYLESLPEAERLKFYEEYNLDPKMK